MNDSDSSVNTNIGATIFMCMLLRPVQIQLLPNGENFCYNVTYNLMQNHQNKSKYLIN